MGRGKPASSFAIACWLVAGLLAAGAIGFLFGPARSQDTAAAPAPATPAEEEAAPQDGRQYEQLLRMALGGCFEPPEDVAPGAVVTIGFDLDDKGRLSGIPELADAGEETADVRRLYLSGALALDRCAPYPPQGAGARFEAVFAADELRALRRIAAPAAEAAASEPQAPAAMLEPANAGTEAALSLNRTKRREVQRRLRLLDFEPGGVDGVFGQKTREAISGWQGEKGFPVSGFLSAVQLQALNAQSQEKYAQYIANRPKEPEPKRRVRVCRPVGLFGLQTCRYEYR